MLSSWLKHLLVCFCVCALLESTGLSVLSIIAKHHITQTDAQAANDEENAAGRNETKESSPKELWSVSTLALPEVYISFKRIIYRDYNHTAHLAWVPSVPTPPPNV